jgi:medium-chain acyl-[acyl-carrier-protein] hydrolase
VTDDWFVSNTRRTDTELTLAVFPQAGGGCGTFALQARQTPGWLDFMTLNLPGRQARFGEPLCTDIDALTAELVSYWEKHPRPYLFFGYCTGALVAYRVACGLQERGAAMPERLVVGSFKPPHLASVEPLSELNSETFWRVLVDNEAVPPMLLAEPELRQLSESVVRADLALAAGYRHADAPPLPIPITVLVGERDSWISASDISAWGQYTTGGLETRVLPAGHWFMEEDSAVAMSALVAEANAVLA